MATSIKTPPGASFAFEMGIRTLDDQLRRVDSFDTKAGILIAADGVLAGLLFSARPSLVGSPRVLAISVAFLVTMSLLLALIAFANRRYRTAPQPTAVVRMMSAPEPWLKWRFLGNLEEAIMANEKKLVWKARFLSAALTTVFVAVGILGAYAVYAVL